MTSPAPAVGADLASALATDLRSVFGQLKRRLREQSDGEDLKPSQVSAVLRLEKDGPSTVSALARAEAMRPQSMSAVVLPLLEAGLLEGVPDPRDGRQTLMTLTPKCRDWLAETRAARQDWLARVIAHKLSPHEQEQLQSALGLLARIAEAG